MRQIEVVNGTTRRVCWVAEDKRVVVGSHVEFKGDPLWWIVDRVYDSRIEHDDIPRGWHVGGLP